MGDRYSSYLVLDYDFWRVIQHLQGLISILLIWEKVDLYIDNGEYKTGVKVKGDKFAINLNKAVENGLNRLGKQG